MLNCDEQYGDFQSWGGGQYRMFTKRGWIICDSMKEVEEELEEIKKEKENQRRKNGKNDKK